MWFYISQCDDFIILFRFIAWFITEIQLKQVNSIIMDTFKYILVPDITCIYNRRHAVDFFLMMHQQY